MSGTMIDNPLHAEGKSTRRKIIEEFEINLGRCILCGLCVEVCNFDAIEMSHEHEISHYARDGRRSDLPVLLEMGKKYQAESNWIAPEVKKAAIAAAKAAATAPVGEETKAVSASAGDVTETKDAPANDTTAGAETKEPPVEEAN